MLSCHFGNIKAGASRPKHVSGADRAVGDEQELVGGDATNCYIAASVYKRSEYVLRVFLDSTQQSSCWAGRIAAPLLPVPKSANFHIDNLRKLGLREFGEGTGTLYLLGSNVGLARRNALASTDFTHLGDALNQFVEKFFFHGQLHCSITCLSAFFCEAVRFSASFFAYASRKAICDALVK